SISGNSYIKSTLTLEWEFYRRNHFNLAANMASIEDNLFERANWPSADKLFGFAAGYGMETILGPAEIKYSWSPDTRKGYLWFSIGFWF
ncbi:MAG TPA: patatin, partial [Flavobacterium sp.]|nr:patatin [Flavobacterium sp.]